MVGYVGIAEHMSLDHLPIFMNRYFEVIGTAIHSRNGTIDKYIGDVVEAFWWQPMGAQLACESALDQMQAMSEFHAWATENGYPSPPIRIGINTGSMRIGEFGTRYHSNYTVMGDHVNLASRLEGINKEYGTRILISESTRKRLSKDMVVRQIDRVRVKGKDDPLGLFELVCRASELPPWQAGFLEVYGQGFSQYFAQDFTGALKSFERAEKISPGDGPSRVLASRCRELIQH